MSDWDFYYGAWFASPRSMWPKDYRAKEPVSRREAFHDLLSLAAHEDSPRLRRGECMVSISALQLRWCRNKDWVRRALRDWESMGFIERYHVPYGKRTRVVTRFVQYGPGDPPSQTRPSPPPTRHQKDGSKTKKKGGWSTPIPPSKNPAKTTFRSKSKNKRKGYLQGKGLGRAEQQVHEHWSFPCVNRCGRFVNSEGSACESCKTRRQSLDDDIRDWEASLCSRSDG